MRPYLPFIILAVTACGGKKDAPPASAPGSDQPTTTATAATATPATAAGQRSSLGKGSSSGEFTPTTRGFKFQNYGNDADTPVENLTAAEVKRMFGDKVCGDTQDGACILTPPAERWMVEQNKGM